MVPLQIRNCQVDAVQTGVQAKEEKFSMTDSSTVRGMGSISIRFKTLFLRNAEMYRCTKHAMLVITQTIRKRCKFFR